MIVHAQSAAVCVVILEQRAKEEIICSYAPELLWQEQCFWPHGYTPQQIVDPALFSSFCGLLLVLLLLPFPLCWLATYSTQSFCALLLVLLHCPMSHLARSATARILYPGWLG
jgi:hypothetical protein